MLQSYCYIKMAVKIVLLAHPYICNIYSMVGRSIASIYDLGGICTSALSASVNMSPQVEYISYRPPYRTMYIMLTQSNPC